MSLYMDSLYWYILVHLTSRPKIDCFGVNEKLTWKKIHMVEHNAAPVFVVIMAFIPAKYQEKAYRV